MTTLADVEYANDQLTEAQGWLHRTIEECFPWHTPVEWDNHGHLCKGQVLRTSMDRVEVENFDTGKVYWINVYHVLKAYREKREGGPE